MTTALDILNYSKTLLASPSNQIVAGLPTGANEDEYAITDTAQLLLWLTEGQERLARLCMPIFDYAVFQAETINDQSLCAYTQLVSPSGRIMHQATEVYDQLSRRLSPASAGYLRSSNWYPSTIDGYPTAWSNNNTGIALSVYSTQPWFTINGYFLPAPVTSTTQVIDPYIDDFSQRTIAFYIAWMVAIKNNDNDVISSRADMMFNQFVTGVQEIYTRLISNDVSLSAIFTAQNIDAQVTVMKQLSART